MCGIAGIYNLNNEIVSPAEIDLLINSLTHRGPDGTGVWLNAEKNLALIHLRLSILDLTEAGNQPMSDSKQRYKIIFNGEIYNFLEIKNKLISKGYEFTTQSDTEVILASYKEWGVEMLNELNGMWAFAIYDSLNNELFLSRDRYGVKPLYYYKSNNKFIFASEVQAIHKILGNRHPLNRNVIEDITSGSLYYHATTQTFLENVYSLPGGYNLFFNGDNIYVKEWYKLKKINIPSKLNEQAEVLKNLIYDSSLIRLRSDVPVGTCLSGGLDSGSITSVISSFKFNSNERFSHYTHRSFCASFPNTPIDESNSAKKLSESTGSNLDTLILNAPSTEELLESVKQCDGPMHALAFFPIWKLYGYIKNQGIIVTLDGQGPDEMLGGYRPLNEALSAALKMKKFMWFLDVYNTYYQLGETSQFSSKKISRYVLKRFLSTKLRIIVKKILVTFGLYEPKKYLNNKSTLIPVREPNDFSNDLDKSLFQQFFQSPLPGILNQYDRCSMAHGVECRMPFMDYRIVEFIFSLPPESKVGGGYTKRVLREAMKGIVPDYIRLNKTKIGFNAPIVDWFRGNLKEFMLEIMNSYEFINSKYFNGLELKKDFENFLSKEKPTWDEAWKFWPPVHYILWARLNNIKEEN